MEELNTDGMALTLVLCRSVTGVSENQTAELAVSVCTHIISLATTGMTMIVTARNPMCVSKSLTKLLKHQLPQSKKVK